MTDYDEVYQHAMTYVEDLQQQVQQGVYYEDEDINVGSIVFEDGSAGAEIWAYYEDTGEEIIYFKGWRRDGEPWYMYRGVSAPVDATLRDIAKKVLCSEGLPYIRITAVEYSVNFLPDQPRTFDATLNECMNLSDKLWIDVRDDDQWFDVNITIRPMMTY
jgi:hypothetical protein